MSHYKYPNIEAERVRHNISQEQLSDELGFERKSYYNWLSNGKIPGNILVKIADKFNCSIDYLLGRTRNPVNSNCVLTERTSDCNERNQNI